MHQQDVVTVSCRGSHVENGVLCSVNGATAMTVFVLFLPHFPLS